MKKVYSIFLMLVSVILFVASTSKVLMNHKEAKILGDSIATKSQKVLLQHVIKAVSKGGTAHALSFCNEQAMPLTDSLSKVYHAKIQRVSDKNRNSRNALSKKDKAIFQAFSNAMKTVKDTVLEEKTHFVYYKPIKIAMPTCLKCHGSATDIDVETLAIIRTRYPKDKAQGYKMGDLRGMWKISFEK